MTPALRNSRERREVGKIRRKNRFCVETARLTLSTELYSSIPIAPTLVRAFNIDTYGNCLFLSQDVELRTMCKKVQCFHFSIELHRQEGDLVPVCLKHRSHCDQR